MEGPEFIHDAVLLQSARQDMGGNFGLSCRNHRNQGRHIYWSRAKSLLSFTVRGPVLETNEVSFP